MSVSVHCYGGELVQAKVPEECSKEQKGCTVTTERELVKKIHQLHNQGIYHRNRAVDVWGSDACYEHLAKRDRLFQKRDALQQALRERQTNQDLPDNIA